MVGKKFNDCANIFRNHICKNPHHQIDHHYDRLHGHMVKNVTAELTSNNEIGVKKSPWLWKHSRPMFELHLKSAQKTFASGDPAYWRKSGEKTKPNLGANM